MLLSLGAAFAFSAISAGAAQAVPFSINANFGYASIGCPPPDACTLDHEQILAPPDSATISGDNTGGSITIPPGLLISRTFQVMLPDDPNPPVPLDVTLNLIAVDQIAGGFDAANGRLDLVAPHIKATAQTVIPNLGPVDCTIDPVALFFSTDPISGYDPGVRFNHPGLAGPGAISAGWTDLPAPVATNPLDLISGAACPQLDPFIDGPGGVWLSKDLSTIGNPPSPTTVTTNPASPSENNNPLVRGTGAADPGNVLIFLGPTCTGISSASGPSATFNGTGIPVAVPEDATTQISVQVRDLAERSSGCTTINYTDPTPPPPVDNGGGGTPIITPPTTTPPVTTTPAPTVKRCKKPRKLKKGKCVKKKKKKK